MKKHLLKWCIAGLAALVLPGTLVFAADITYDYDDLGRLKNVVVENGYSAGYGYDNVGNRENKTISTLATSAFASLNAFPLNDTDYAVMLDATGSMCFEGGVEVQCSFVFDFGDNGAGQLLGGNGLDTWFYQYAGPGSYIATLTVTSPSATDSKQVTVSPLLVVEAVPEINFNVVTNGLSVTVSASPSYLENVIDATVYWGDGRSSPNADLINGVTHDYSYARTYHLRVRIVFDRDVINNVVDYIYFENPELEVTVP